MARSVDRPLPDRSVDRQRARRTTAAARIEWRESAVGVKAAPIALATAAVVALACNASIRFDEGTADAGSLDVVVDSPAPGCPNATCGWESDDCDGSVCHQSCRASTTCVGTCGNSCSAECESASHCALTTGRNASVACSEGANCTFVLGDHARAECAGGSTCNVLCVEYCNLECDAAATCELQCPNGISMTVSGS